MADDFEEKLEKALKDIAHGFHASKALWAEYQAGDRSLADVARVFEAELSVVVQDIGEVWPAIPDKSEREKLAEKLVLSAMDLAGIDLPGPDRIYVHAAVKAAVWAWRAMRAQKASS